MSVPRPLLERPRAAALLALGNGFLAHPENTALRTRITNGELPLTDFFGQLLRLVYRLIFLLVAEDRDLLHPPDSSQSAAKLYAEGHIVPNNDYGASIQSFMRGDGGVMVNGTWLIGDLVDQSALAGAPLEKGYQAIPFANLFGKPATWADGHSWVMLKGGTKDEKTKQAALRYLKFLSDNNGEWARTGQLATSQRIISGSAFNALPFRTSIGVIAQNGISLPPTIARQFRIQELLGEALGSIMLSKKPVDETIKATEKRINKMLAGVK